MNYNLMNEIMGYPKHSIYIDDRIIDIDEQLANMGEELFDISINFVETNNENVIQDKNTSQDKNMCQYKNMNQDKNINCCSNVSKQFCCLCGISKKYHSKTHKFFECLDEYKCIKCSKFFFQHNHQKNPCFCPKKYIC